MILALIIVLVAPALPALGLRIAGFQPLEQPLTLSTAEAIPIFDAPQNVSQAILSAGSYGQQTLNSSSAYTIQTGNDENGNTIAQITVSENGIAILCGQYSNVCSANGSPFRNANVNLENNRVTIAGEAFISSLNTWQPIAVIASLSPTNTVQIEAVDINGTLFGIPDGELGDRIRDIQVTANQAIRQLSLQSNGITYRLDNIIITETQLVATFR